MVLCSLVKEGGKKKKGKKKRRGEGGKGNVKAYAGAMELSITRVSRG